MHDKDCLCRQRVELLGGRLSDAVVFHLPIYDHVHEFDSAKQDASAAEILEPEHGASAPLDRAVVLVPLHRGYDGLSEVGTG
jgi:hypothetical protein